MMHPDTELRFISPQKGYGVVATRPIPKGTITWAGDHLDQHFTEAEFAAFAPVYRKILNTYCYRDHKGLFVLCWDHGRFVNHSFRSNCISTAYNFELAVRDIAAGEELTDDYGYLNLWEPFNALPEEGCARTAALPDDLLHYHEEWDAQLTAAFRHFNGVEQPLAGLIEPRYRDKVQRVAAGQSAMDSIINCYFKGEGTPYV